MSTVVHSRGVGGQNWLNLTHVVVEWPLVVRVRRPSTIFFPGLQALHKCGILLLFSFRCMLFFKLPQGACSSKLLEITFTLDIRLLMLLFKTSTRPVNNQKVIR